MVVYKGIAEDSKGLVYIIPTGRNGELMILDKKTDRMRAIRYSSNHPSIYFDQQKTKAILPAVMLKEGYLTVDDSEKMLIEFLDIHPLFGIKFARVDKEADAKEQLETEELVLDIHSAIRNKGKEKYGEVALKSLLNIKSKSLTLASLSEMGASQVRQALYNLASNTPSDFVNSKGTVDCFDSNLFLIKDLIIRGISEGIIKINLSGTRLSWSNGEEITSIPRGKDYLDYVAEWFSDKEGKKTMQALSLEIESLYK